ncbi:MAG: ribose 5-phosphate isomerase B [Gemmatimonadaceae bacterium]
MQGIDDIDASPRLPTMHIVLGSDHAGFRLKQRIIALLRDRGHLVTDLGTHSEEPVDYPRFIRPVAEAVARGESERGIVLGGSGNGEAIVANRVRGVRCTLCWSLESARLARAHNDSNVLSLGARLVPDELVTPLIDIWLTTPFDGGRHLRRIREIDGMSDTEWTAGAVGTTPTTTPMTTPTPTTAPRPGE